jgi:beta-mannanase
VAASAPRSIALGVYQHGAPWTMEPLAAFEALAERPVDIVMWYQDWALARNLDLTMLQRVVEHDACPLITWEPWDATRGAEQPTFHLTRLLAGDHDQFVETWARQLAAFGHPVLLRWGHEMNGHWYPWSVGRAGTSAANYVESWRHLWSVFRAAGADNVQWIWSPNALAGARAFEPCYPGDAFVDWVGLDGYNWGGWRHWRSFSQLFDESYRRITVLTPKPLMIAETACAEAGMRKARWITDALTVQIPRHFPRVQAVVWFNLAKERDWRIESSPASRQAFAEAVAGPCYRMPGDADHEMAATPQDETSP